MNFIVKSAIISAAALLFLGIFPARLAAQDQQPMSPEEMEKKRLEYIDKEKERLVSLLDLEYYQEFWVDSTLTHDLAAMQDQVPASLKEHYLSLAHHAGECLGCRGCESRCPFGVPVAERMKKTEALFGA